MDGTFQRTQFIKNEHISFPLLINLWFFREGPMGPLGGLQRGSGALSTDQRWALAVLGLGSDFAVLRYYHIQIFLPQCKIPQLGQFCHNNTYCKLCTCFFAELLKAFSTISFFLAKFWKSIKTFWMTPGPSKQQSWAFAFFKKYFAGLLWLFYQIPQFFFKCRYHKTTSAHCPITQYHIPHNMPTSATDQ